MLVQSLMQAFHWHSSSVSQTFTMKVSNINWWRYWFLAVCQPYSKCIHQFFSYSLYMQIVSHQSWVSSAVNVGNLYCLLNSRNFKILAFLVCNSVERCWAHCPTWCSWRWKLMTFINFFFFDLERTLVLTHRSIFSSTSSWFNNNSNFCLYKFSSNQQTF